MISGPTAFFPHLPFLPHFSTYFATQVLICAKCHANSSKFTLFSNSNMNMRRRSALKYEQGVFGLEILCNRIVSAGIFCGTIKMTLSGIRQVLFSVEIAFKYS